MWSSWNKETHSIYEIRGNECKVEKQVGNVWFYRGDEMKKHFLYKGYKTLWPGQTTNVINRQTIRGTFNGHTLVLLDQMDKRDDHNTGRRHQLSKEVSYDQGHNGNKMKWLNFPIQVLLRNSMIIQFSYLKT